MLFWEKLMSPTYPFPSLLFCLSAFPPICFIVQILSLVIYSFKFDLCKHEYLKSFCLIINSACHNYIYIKSHYFPPTGYGKTIYSKWKYLSLTMTLKMRSRSCKHNQYNKLDSIIWPCKFQNIHPLVQKISHVQVYDHENRMKVIYS